MDAAPIASPTPPIVDHPTKTVDNFFKNYFAGISMTSVLAVLLFAAMMLFLCLFWNWKMQCMKEMMGANEHMVANRQANTPFDVRSTRWYSRLLSSVITQINDIAGSESFKRRGGKIKLLGGCSSYSYTSHR